MKADAAVGSSTARRRAVFRAAPGRGRLALKRLAEFCSRVSCGVPSGNSVGRRSQCFRGPSRGMDSRERAHRGESHATSAQALTPRPVHKQSRVSAADAAMRLNVSLRCANARALARAGHRRWRSDVAKRNGIHGVSERGCCDDRAALVGALATRPPSAPVVPVVSARHGLRIRHHRGLRLRS